jgi:hypothetical protein
MNGWLYGSPYDVSLFCNLRNKELPVVDISDIAIYINLSLRLEDGG